MRACVCMCVRVCMSASAAIADTKRGFGVRPLGTVGPRGDVTRTCNAFVMLRRTDHCDRSPV